jgi:hypothetical protein
MPKHAGGNQKKRQRNALILHYFSNTIPEPVMEDVNPEVTFMEPGVTSDEIR